MISSNTTRWTVNECHRTLFEINRGTVPIFIYCLTRHVLHLTAIPLYYIAAGEWSLCFKKLMTPTWYIIFFAVLIWSGISPKDYFTMCSEIEPQARFTKARPMHYH